MTLSSLGILYSDIFNAIPFFKNLSTYFLSLVEEYSNFKFIRPIPSGVVSILEPTNNVVDINNNHINIYNVLGLLVFGFFTVTASIVFIDRWNPDFWAGVPLIQSFAESINNYINYFSSWFSTPIDNTTTGSAGSAGINTTTSVISSPTSAPISPTLSTCSDTTITPPRFDLPINPPKTPYPSINPWD